MQKGSRWCEQLLTAVGSVLGRHTDKWSCALQNAVTYLSHITGKVNNDRVIFVV